MECLADFNLTEYPVFKDANVVGIQLLGMHDGLPGTTQAESYVAWAGTNTFQDGRSVHINPKVHPDTLLYAVAERWCRTVLDRLGIQPFELTETRSVSPGGMRASVYVRDMVSNNPTMSNRFVAFFRTAVTSDGRREMSSFVLCRNDVPVEALSAAEEWISKLEQYWSER